MKKIIGLVLVLFSSFVFPGLLFAQEETTPSGIAITDVEKFVDDYAEEYIGNTTAGASIAVVKDNEIVLSKGYGYADIENGRKMNAATDVLEWGSVSKLVVWVAVMQLVEQGKIDLNEDIKNYLPDGFLPKLTYEEPITVLHLMNHTAGFEENIYDLGYASADQVRSLEEGLKLAEPKQVYRPGEMVAYSNYSTSLAAYIIERITDQEFYEYVSDHIFSKLDMDHTSAHLPVEENKEIIQNRTEGYELSEPGNFVRSTHYYMSMYPSGGINGTVGDLAKFAMALMPADHESTVLFEDEATLETMLSQSYSANENLPGAAHGLWEYDGASRGLTHPGGTVSFSSNFHIVPEEHFAVVILTNQAAELDIAFELPKGLLGSGDKTVVENLPGSKNLEGSYMTTRKMESSFLNIYYYFTRYNVKSVNTNDIQVSIGGLTADYVQTSPHIFKMTSGHSVFLPTNVLYFQMENGEVKHMSASMSDYLPVEKSNSLLIVNAALFAYCMLYFLLSPFALAVTGVSRWRKKTPSPKIKKWNALLNLSGTAIILNVVVLVFRMFSSSDRAYSEILFQLILNYSFTITSAISLGMILANWKTTTLTTIQKTFYIFSALNIAILLTLLFEWHFYS